MENLDHIIAIIKEACVREEKIIAVYLFGSSVTGQIRSAVDIDVALLLE
jgi:predicted nucleotidyltransferase